MVNTEKCFFCEREIKLEWARILFDPRHIPGEEITQDWSKIKSCCMSCEGKVKEYMTERETKQAVNKDGKLLFFLDDGEFWWYLGDSKDQVIEYHKKANEGEDTIVDKCEPVSVLKALQNKIRLDEIDENENQIKVIMFDFINDGEWHYENGVAPVASSVF